MSAGENALAGRPDSVIQAGISVQSRTVGTDVFVMLQAAAGDLGGESGSALSVQRLLGVIQSCAEPMRLLQAADGEWGRGITTLGRAMEDIAQRAGRAGRDVSEAQDDQRGAADRLDAFDAANGACIPGALRSAMLNEVSSASERASAASNRLSALEGERAAADARAVDVCWTQRGNYVDARNALPLPPSAAAGVKVDARMPDGSTMRVSAVDLATLKDVDAIRRVWDALDPAQRQRLIADFPLLIGNLDGIPLRDRNTANVISATAYRSELAQRIRTLELAQQQPHMAGVYASTIASLEPEIRSIDAILGDRNGAHAGEKGTDGQPFGEYLVFEENGRSSSRAGTTLVSFDPLRDSIVTYQGALDAETGDIPAWMTSVGVVVPGTNSTLGEFTAELDRVKRLVAASGDDSGYFAWHGAPMPEFGGAHGASTEPAMRGFADTAAPRLASFVNNLALAAGTDVVPIGHSYGAAVLGLAELTGLKADRVVYVAPAGLGHGVSGIDDFPNTKDVPHFVLQARNDLVVGTSQGVSAFGLGHGSANPLTADGIVRLETGFLTDGDPASGTVESVGGFESHSIVFRSRSTSLKNIASVVNGTPVSLYHPDDYVVDQWGNLQTIPGSGAGKPEELVSPSHPTGEHR